MKKRTFLKTSSLLVTGTLLSPFMTNAQNPPRTNWAGNLTYSTDNLYQPKTVAKAQQTIKDYDKLRVLGSRHSFNAIADSTENQINLDKFDQAMTVNEDGKTVTVNAGVSYGHLCPYLDRQGYALHNLASLPHISIAGACATATHGSGMNSIRLSQPGHG
jgi:xylitol oxidase